MFFKAVDSFFKEIKQLLSVIALALLSMSILMFLYWLFFIAKLDMPQWLNSFIWAVIDFFAQNLISAKDYEKITDILPVLCSILFAFFTYIVNCTILFLENNHKKYKKSVENYKLKLEKTINSELHKDFLNELKKQEFMLVKMQISVKNNISYLSTGTDTVDEAALGKEIEQCILASVKANGMKTKGKTEKGAYFMLSDFTNSKEFFEELVSKASKIISSYISKELLINFYCCAEVFDDLSRFEEISAYLDRINSLKIKNKIVITPRYKVCFDNLYSSLYEFKVLGEYNISDDEILQKNTMLYSMKSR